MSRVLLPLLLSIAIPLNAHSAETYVAGQPTGKTIKDAIAFLDQHCLTCHDNDTMKGDLSLEELGPVDETNAGQWKAVWAQVALKQMPPKKKKQPEVVRRLFFTDWIVEELSEAMREKGGFHAHLDPKKGNYLDHELLFGELPPTIDVLPASSPARLWRVSKEEHLARLNEFIHKEPPFDPRKPGLRNHGDALPYDSNGGTQIHLGAERVIQFKGADFTAGIKSFGPILSSVPLYGLENYPHFYSVNNAETLQILNLANEFLRYMAYGPLSFANPQQIADNPDRNSGFTHAYTTKVIRPLTPVYELMKSDDVDDQKLQAAIEFVFESLAFRPPTPAESQEYMALTKSSVTRMGKEKGVVLGLSGIFLDRDALFRPELGAGGQTDEHGRVMLQDWELGLAVNHALRYLKPDKVLRQAIIGGRMQTREDVRREVTRMLADDSIRKPRVLQFFRDYFDHDLAGSICKDNTALKEAGFTRPWKRPYYWNMFSASASTDRLIELILEEDNDVFKELLTTQRVVVSQEGMHLGRKLNDQEMDQKLEENTKAYAELRKKHEPSLKAIAREIEQMQAKVEKDSGDKSLKKSLDLKKKEQRRLKDILKAAKRNTDRNSMMVEVLGLSGPDVYVRSSRAGIRSDRTPALPSRGKLALMPEGQRLGLLTQPAWLVSHTDANGNHPIHRGIWVRERLLGGGIPDVPITVDAQLPDEPENTLRDRMRVTRDKYCWSCHQKMDPLGLPFEMYNHIGLLRSEEKGRPVDTTGAIIDSGDPELDGDVTDAIDMIRRIAESDRAEQVFVRHAFRFWMGRNETLNDRSVIQDAYRAYKENDGSMNALITSLLTSDAFLYRKP